VILAPEKVIDEIVDVFYIFHVSDTLSSPSMVFYSFSSFYWSFLRPDSQSLAKRRKAHNRKKDKNEYKKTMVEKSIHCLGFQRIYNLGSHVDLEFGKDSN